VVNHEPVLEAIMARGAVLPLRFGTQLAREEELEAVLAARRDELLRSLERVRGKVELGVRIIPQRPLVPGTSGPEPTGRGYLLARVRAHRRREEATREVHTVLAALSAASCVRPAERPPAIFVAAYLVDSDRVSEFRLEADQLAGAQPSAQLVVSGPWPPYSFVSEQQ
jgi:hypothetical protein